MQENLKSQNLSLINLHLILISFLNFFFWVFFGYLLTHKEFENYEIIFPLLILMLNTIVAMSVIFFTVFLWEGKRTVLYFTNMLPGISILFVDFIVIYPNINEIFSDL